MHGGTLLQPGCCEFVATSNEACLWLSTPADFFLQNGHTVCVPCALMLLKVLSVQFS